MVFAFEDANGTTPGEPVTGDAANITANVRIDGGAANAVDDTNPTELANGYYIFDITAAETNGDLILIDPVSATANVNVVGVPGVVYTQETTGNVETTIATLASQTSFTLTGGSADDNAYNGWAALVVDATTNDQRALGVVSDYTGATKTVTLESDPGVFTMAAGDTVILIPGFLTDTVNANVVQVSGDTAAADNLEADYDGTGYNKSNSTVGTVTTNTDMRGTDGANTTTPPTAAAIRTEIDANSTQIAAVKAKTDSLTFTKAGEVDANTQSINDGEVTGDGKTTPFDIL